MVDRMKRLLHLAVAVPVVFSAACETTRSVGYSDGWVTSSPVAYSFAAPPQLTDTKGRSYRTSVDGATTPGELSSFAKQGMKATNGTADVEVAITLGDLAQGDPGAVEVGKSYYPAFTVSVPYRIVFAQQGRQLGQSGGTYENMLTFKNGQRFESREQAVAAIDLIRKLGQKGIEQKARAAAADEAKQRANEAAARLFEPRDVSLEVPVVRSAAGLDLQQPYEMLRDAKSPDQVEQALASYEQLGTQHTKADGSPNRTANYGVACGIAACKLMLRDLRGAWDASKAANEFEPEGEEVDKIRLVIYQQEKTTGVRVIPDEDRAKIAEHERMANSLQSLFGTPAK